MPFSPSRDFPSSGELAEDGLRVELTAAVADLVSVSTLLAVFLIMLEKKSISKVGVRCLSYKKKNHGQPNGKEED